MGQKQKDRLRVHETPIREVIFVTLTNNSSLVTNDTQEPWKYRHHRKYLWGYCPQQDRSGLRRPEKDKHQH